jgi:hypothetical protein
MLILTDRKLDGSNQNGKDGVCHLIGALSELPETLDEIRPSTITFNFCLFVLEDLRNRSRQTTGRTLQKLCIN